MILNFQCILILIFEGQGGLIPPLTSGGVNLKNEVLKCLEEIEEKITVWDIKALKHKLVQIAPDDEIDYLIKLSLNRKECE